MWQNSEIDSSLDIHTLRALLPSEIKNGWSLCMSDTTIFIAVCWLIINTQIELIMSFRN